MRSKYSPIFRQAALILTIGTAPLEAAPVVQMLVNNQVQTLRSNEVRAWGTNTNGQASVPAGILGAVKVVAGQRHSIALRGNRRVTGWGSSAGLGNAFNSWTGVIDVAAGSDCTVLRRTVGQVTQLQKIGTLAMPLGVTDGRVSVAFATSSMASTAGVLDSQGVVWRDFLTFESGQTQFIRRGWDVSGQKALAVGNAFVYSLRPDGSVAGWGLNGDHIFDLSRPLDIPVGLYGVIDIVVAGGKPYALRRAGTVVTWFGGQLLTLAGYTDIKAIAGGGVLMAIKSNGSVLTTGSSPVPNTIVKAISVSAGNGHYLALLDKAPTVDLGSATYGNTVERSVVLKNAGDQPLTISSVTMEGFDATDFSLPEPPPTGLVAGATRTLRVKFTPTARGQRFGRLRVVTNDAITPVAELRFLANVKAPAIEIKPPGEARLTSGLGTLLGWGQDDRRQVSEAAGIKGVKAVAAGAEHSSAIVSDGRIVHWGQVSIVNTPSEPALEIAAGDDGSVALFPGGQVVITTDRWYRQHGYGNGSQGLVWRGDGIAYLEADGGLSIWDADTYPPFEIATLGTLLRGFALARNPEEGGMTLSQTGQVLPFGDWRVLPKLGTIKAVAATNDDSLALRTDGTLIRWNRATGIRAPDMPGVAKVAASFNYTLMELENGGIIGQGNQPQPPQALGFEKTLIPGDYHSFLLLKSLTFRKHHVGHSSTRTFELSNRGNADLHVRAVTIEGPDSSEFVINAPFPATIVPSSDLGASPGILSVSFQPKIGGDKSARIRIETDDPDPDQNPFYLPISGYAMAEVATANGIHSRFTPLTRDRNTGLIVQTLTYHNATGLNFPNGIKFEISDLPPGVSIFSSSSGREPGVYDVLYTNPVTVDQTITLALAYYDPLRRTSAQFQPTIAAVALHEAIPQPGETVGTPAIVQKVVATKGGPLVMIKSVANGHYVVEYSDDNQASWHSAVHVLKAGGTALSWIDRGQPETKTKPVGTPMKPGGRYYRAKKL
jgi:Abnormal spindle-like microcephaly-assoc'd, ASPM-SPD-2-Hydin